MRIAFVTTSWPAGPGDASGHFVQAEAAELERAGHEIVVVTPRVGHPGSAFGWPGAAARVAQRPLRAFDGAVWVVAARARLRAIAVERVIAHWAIPCGWPIAVSARSPRDGTSPAPPERGRNLGCTSPAPPERGRNLGCTSPAPPERGLSIEVVSHGADVRLLLGLPRPIRDCLAQTIATRVSAWRFVSEELQEELLGALGTRARAAVARIAVVRAAPLHMPDVFAAGEQLRRSLGVANVAVSVGRLVKTKRIERAIDYVARSREMATLVVVGDGPERGRLERFARSRGVDARFVGLLPREKALAWIAAADVVLHGSAKEGLSTVVREAEALGKAVVWV
jgi:teichuronic acid biosynthesis glycosyltransferase TuaC